MRLRPSAVASTPLPPTGAGAGAGERWLRRIYTGLLYLMLPLALLRLYWRGYRDPGHRQRWRERLGFVPQSPTGGLWLHAVSVGETRAALPLIRALQARYPDRPLLVTTTTLTGSRQVREALGEQVHHVYAPYDLPGAVARFLRNTQPRLAVIMETELWPNLLRQCAVAGIPTVIANARLSERSARGYARIRGLTGSMLRDITLIAAQAEADAERFRALGAPRVQVTGNLKYDLSLPATLPEQGRALRRDVLGENRPVWIAASTHAGEDEPILDAFAILRIGWPELLLILTPRHPERFDRVAALCRQRGFPTVRRSEQRPCAPDSAVFLGDSMGELLQFYAAADLAFVGGSLVATGGHNVLEPALLGLPVLFGPHMFNFTEAGERLLEAEAAWQIANAAELAVAVERLLTDPERRQAAGQRGRAVVKRHRGALAALLAGIEEHLPYRR
ncbi:MAG: lipid IV(A) 3-deoxy-D-manno-octulosonic acid transferase [Candidatus Contendobacter sp.]|nr:lipid IV(A) 3-deoxy-D-manno-octulosonic acid transferase [Candidatus Contendobacter sp.]